MGIPVINIDLFSSQARIPRNEVRMVPPSKKNEYNVTGLQRYAGLKAVYQRPLLPVDPRRGLGDVAPDLEDNSELLLVDPRRGLGDVAPPLTELDGNSELLPVGDVAPDLEGNSELLLVDPRRGVGDVAPPLTELDGNSELLPVDPRRGVGDIAPPLTDLEGSLASVQYGSSSSRAPTEEIVPAVQTEWASSFRAPIEHGSSSSHVPTEENVPSIQTRLDYLERKLGAMESEMLQFTRRHGSSSSHVPTEENVPSIQTRLDYLEQKLGAMESEMLQFTRRHGSSSSQVPTEENVPSIQTRLDYLERKLGALESDMQFTRRHGSSLSDKIQHGFAILFSILVILFAFFQANTIFGKLLLAGRAGWNQVYSLFWTPRFPSPQWVAYANRVYSRYVDKYAYWLVTFFVGHVRAKEGSLLFNVRFAIWIFTLFSLAIIIGYAISLICTAIMYLYGRLLGLTSLDK